MREPVECRRARLRLTTEPSWKARRTSFPEELERGGAASEIYRLTSAELYRPGEDTVKFFTVLLGIHSSGRLNQREDGAWRTMALSPISDQGVFANVLLFLPGEVRGVTSYRSDLLAIHEIEIMLPDLSLDAVSLS